MNIYIGNFTAHRMASEMGIELTQEDEKALEEIRQDDAQRIQPGKYHCFDIPRVIMCGDIDTCYKVAAILKKYTIEGRWQVSVYSS